MKAIRKATKTANIWVTIHEGAFDIAFDCVGVELCREALCHIMPPDGSEECTFREYGVCSRPLARAAALESLIRRLNKELKELKEQNDL